MTSTLITCNSTIPGNIFTVKHDNGNIYRFGYEEMCGFTSLNVTFTPMSSSIVCTAMHNLT